MIGASFIGLEVAASLRARGLEVHVVAPETRPMERVLGPELGDFVRALHEEHGVDLPPRDSVERDRRRAGDARRRRHARGRPRRRRRRRAAARSTLAEQAGLAIDRGVVVNEYLETSAPGIFAAGDIARWPDPHSRRAHPRRALGGRRAPGPDGGAQHARAQRERFDAVPFFWSQHYDVPINYVGHAEKWDEIEVDGDIAGEGLPRALQARRPHRSPWPRSSATSKASRPRWRWRRADAAAVERARCGRGVQGEAPLPGPIVRTVCSRPA